MGLWQNIKVRLGLEDEWDGEYYDDDEYHDADEPDQAEDEYASPRAVSRPAYGVSTGVRRSERVTEGRSRATELRSVPTGGASVTSVAPQVKMHIVEPKSFSEAQTIADRFKQGTPVIMNMTMTQPDLCKRLIDFASGLTYGLDGGLQKISDKVFMITPHNVDVSAGEVRRLQDKGLFSLEP